MKNQITAILSVLILSACGGGGGSSTSAESSYSPTQLITSVVQVTQSGFSDNFLPNGKTTLDLRARTNWSYYYIYFTNNQPNIITINASPPVPTRGNNYYAFTEVVTQATDNQSCKNQSQIKPGGQCRVLLRSVIDTSPLYPKNQAESFDTHVEYGYCWHDDNVYLPVCMQYGEQVDSPTTGISIPSIAGLWTVASSGNPVAGDKLEAYTKNGDFFYTNYPTAYAAEAKYQITYHDDGTAWIDFQNPVQIFNYAGSKLNPLFTLSLQQIGESDGALWSQNAGGLSWEKAVYNNSSGLWYAVPTWLSLSDVGISTSALFTNGMDGNLYLRGGVNAYYRFTGSGFTQLNLPIDISQSYLLAAPDGSIIYKDGCLRTSDGINYSFTPFTGVITTASSLGGFAGKMYSDGHEIDLDNCTINPYPAYSVTPSGFTDLKRGFFAAAGGNFMYYPYGPKP